MFIPLAHGLTLSADIPSVHKVQLVTSEVRGNKSDEIT